VETSAHSVANLDLRIAREREGHRRRRIVQKILLLALMATALCVVVVWQRNRVRLADASERFRSQLSGLQEFYQSTGTLPGAYPFPDELIGRVVAEKFTYVGGELTRLLGPSRDDLIVAYTPSIRQVFGSDVRIVALVEGDRLRVERIPDNRFRRMLRNQQDQVRRPG